LAGLKAIFKVLLSVLKLVFVRLKSVAKLERHERMNVPKHPEF
jgi:hypothetical protein